MTDIKTIEYAKSLINNGDYLGAEASLLARIKIDPVPADIVLLLARSYFMQLQVNNALGLLQNNQNLRPCVDALREYFVGERLNREAMQLIQNTVKSGCSYLATLHRQSNSVATSSI